MNLFGEDDWNEKTMTKDWLKIKKHLRAGCRAFIALPLGMLILPFLFTLISDG